MGILLLTISFLILLMMMLYLLNDYKKNIKTLENKINEINFNLYNLEYNFWRGKNVIEHD